MSGRRWLWCVALVCAATGLSCSDVTSPTNAPQKKLAPTSASGAKFSRYILISGVVTCIEECDNDDPGGRSKIDGWSGFGGLPLGDSLQLPPADVP